MLEPVNVPFGDMVTEAATPPKSAPFQVPTIEDRDAGEL
jgi:hypothetical protein